MPCHEVWFLQLNPAQGPGVIRQLFNSRLHARLCVCVCVIHCVWMILWEMLDVCVDVCVDAHCKCMSVSASEFVSGCWSVCGCVCVIDPHDSFLPHLVAEQLWPSRPLEQWIEQCPGPNLGLIVGEQESWAATGDPSTKEGGFVGHVNLARAVAGWLLCWGQSSGSGPKQTEKRLLKWRWSGMPLVEVSLGAHTFVLFASSMARVDGWLEGWAPKKHAKTMKIDENSRLLQAWFVRICSSNSSSKACNQCHILALSCSPYCGLTNKSVQVNNYCLFM